MKENLDASDNISWSAHFANLQEASPHPPAITGILPLLRENAQTLSMVKHGMNIIQKAPGQVPVLTVDQSLYSIAKRSWPADYGEGNFVVQLGGLHIETAILKLMGELVRLKWLGECNGSC